MFCPFSRIIVGFPRSMIYLISGLVHFSFVGYGFHLQKWDLHFFKQLVTTTILVPVLQQSILKAGLCCRFQALQQHAEYLQYGFQPVNLLVRKHFKFMLSMIYENIVFSNRSYNEDLLTNQQPWQQFMKFGGLHRQCWFPLPYRSFSGPIVDLSAILLVCCSGSSFLYQ